MRIALCLAFALALLPAVGSAATHTVTQSGFTFIPADLTIDVGDTVEWIWTGGLHTVTEGLDDLTPPIVDKLFDAPLTAAEPLFSFTFTEAGVVDYYCRPHLVLGMVGVVRVQGSTPAPEPLRVENWSRVKNLYR